jgi:pre-mRNA-splicing factor 18
LVQPIQLYAETDEERLERYHAVSATLPTENEDDRVLKNMEHGIAEKQLFDERGNSKQESETADAGDGDDKDEEDELAPTFVPATPEQNVSRHFKQLIKLWEEELGARTEAETRTGEGKRQVGTYQQCRRHMKPFFKQLKHRSMPLDVLNTMIEITLNMQQREYVKAHDAYIRCAIGNAPWPMGISGTGVHERQGRQHIRESALAHIMNDETQRKYLQSVKRLMTFSQRVLPGSGPSKQVG